MGGVGSGMAKGGWEGASWGGVQLCTDAAAKDRATLKTQCLVTVESIQLSV